MIAVSQYHANKEIVPPLGVFLISGCSADLLINILLTILGYVPFYQSLSTKRRLTTYRYFPGHIHAFYLEYVYYNRRGSSADGSAFTKPATGVYSERIQTGGGHLQQQQQTQYGTIRT